jgi:ABC-type proline/glycine betaine transport system permease subunit
MKKSTEDQKSSAFKKHWDNFTANMRAAWDVITHAFLFIRDFLTAATLTWLIYYAVTQAREEPYHSITQLSVYVASGFVLIFALTAWSRLVRNYGGSK